MNDLWQCEKAIHLSFIIFRQLATCCFLSIELHLPFHKQCIKHDLPILLDESHVVLWFKLSVLVML